VRAGGSESVMEQQEKTGIFATISIVAAVGSYIATCMGHPVWGLVAALASIPLGIVGLVLSASPRVGGGMLSIAAIALGALGLIFAILGMVGVALF